MNRNANPSMKNVALVHQRDAVRNLSVSVAQHGWKVKYRVTPALIIAASVQIELLILIFCLKLLFSFSNMSMTADSPDLSL